MRQTGVPVWMGTRQVWRRSWCCRRYCHRVDWCGWSAWQGSASAVDAAVHAQSALLQAITLAPSVTASGAGMGRLASGPGIRGAPAGHSAERRMNKMPLPACIQSLAGVAGTAFLVLEAFPGTFPASRRALAVGNPVRISLRCCHGAALCRSRRSSAPAGAGGQSGALALNQLVPQALAQLPEAARPEVCIRPVAGQCCRYRCCLSGRPGCGATDAFLSTIWPQPMPGRDLVLCCRIGPLRNWRRLVNNGKSTYFIFRR